MLLTTHKDFHLNLKYKVNGFELKLDLIKGKRFIAVVISSMTDPCPIDFYSELCHHLIVVHLVINNFLY